MELDLEWAVADRQHDVLHYHRPTQAGRSFLTREVAVLSLGTCLAVWVYVYLPYASAGAAAPFKYEVMGISRVEYLLPRALAVAISVALTTAALVLLRKRSRCLFRLNLIALCGNGVVSIWIAREWMKGLWSMHIG